MAQRALLSHVIGINLAIIIIGAATERSVGRKKSIKMNANINILKLLCKTALFNLAMVLALGLIAGCTQGATAPKPEDSATTPEYESPSEGTINETLAEQSGEERLVYRIGPIDLPAGTDVDIEDKLILNFQIAKPMWAVGFEPRVVNTNGEALDGQLLHSAIISNKHEENPLCTSSNVGNPFFVTTSTLTNIRFPKGYGYPILNTDPLEAKVVMRNPTEASYLNVYFEITIIAKPMNEFSKMHDIKPMLFDVDECNHSPISIEPNNISRTQATYALQNPYKLIVAHGALQNYGICVDLTANKDVLPFWTAEAVVDDQNFILDLRNDPFEDPSGLPFKRGDSLTLSVVYDNTSDSWVEDATAAAMIYMAQEDE